MTDCESVGPRSNRGVHPKEANLDKEFERAERNWLEEIGLPDREQRDQIARRFGRQFNRNNLISAEEEEELWRRPHRWDMRLLRWLMNFKSLRAWAFRTYIGKETKPP